LRRLKGSLPVMVCLWVSVLGATITHFQLDFWAGVAFVPYMIWVTVAGALNFTVWRLNPHEKPLRPAEIEV
jgi:translocator protein